MMGRPSPRARAFTLIELMMVIAIIGILAAIAVPSFTRFRCRAEKVEAYQGLKALRDMSMAFKAENDRYPMYLFDYGPTWGPWHYDPEGVGFARKGDGRYNYMMWGSASWVDIYAFNMRTDGTWDWWYVDPNGTPTNYWDACQQSF